VTRYLCAGSGLSQEWVDDMAGVEKLRAKFNVKDSTQPEPRIGTVSDRPMTHPLLATLTTGLGSGRFRWPRTVCPSG
jgi:hypothetical protein